MVLGGMVADGQKATPPRMSAGVLAFFKFLF
jgi:hypothetical protein